VLALLEPPLLVLVVLVLVVLVLVLAIEPLAVTRTIAVACTPPASAVMVVVPLPTAVTRPSEFTVATFVS